MKKATSFWLSLAFIVGVAVFAVLALRPYISRAGDTFSCWFDYVQNWRAHGLTEALRRADSPGRYPGYPFLIMVFQFFNRVSFLTALRFLRVFSLVGAFVSLFFFFVLSGLRKPLAFLYAFGVALIPGVWINSALNSQDTPKLFLFMLSCILAIRITVQSKNQFYTYASFSVCSILLAALRGPEVLPLYGFIVMLVFLSRGRSLKESVKPGALLVSPSLIFLFGIHLWGLHTVGHLSVSGPPGHRDFWIMMAVNEVKKNAPSGFFGHFFGFLKLVGVAYLNKMSYMVEDFVFAATDIRILDDHFISTLQRLTPLRLFVYYPTVIVLTVASGWLACRKKTCPISRALIAGGIVGALYYLIGFNHYEPRYWIICFVAPLAAFIVEFGRSKLSLTICLCYILSVAIPVTFLVHKNDLAIDLETTALAEKWQKDGKQACLDHVKDILIPENFYLFTSYRYFVAPLCPGLNISMIGHSPEKENLPTTIVFPVDYFEDSHILGLDHGKFTF